MDQIKELDEITIKSVEFTLKHINHILQYDPDHPATLLFLHGTKKPHLDLLSYCSAFLEGTIYSKFHEKFGRFPTKDELIKVAGYRNKMFQEISSALLHYEIKGPVNIIPT